MAETFHLNFAQNSASHWVIEAMPFFPQIEIQPSDGGGDQTMRVRFNKGYIFDYANSVTRIDVKTAPENEYFEIDKEGVYTFFLTFSVDESTGKIITDNDEGPAIFQEGGDAPAPNAGQAPLQNLVLIEECENLGEPKTKDKVGLDPNATVGKQKRKVDIDICKIKNGILEELYLRDNLHLWFRGVRSNRPTDATINSYQLDEFYVVPLLKKGDEEEPNGLLDVKSLFYPQTYVWDDGKEYINQLTMIVNDNNTIGLFVKGSDEVTPDN